ncbi:hypothetical protein CPC16_002969, partial [Podila verticillata]
MPVLYANPFRWFDKELVNGMIQSATPTARDKWSSDRESALGSGCWLESAQSSKNFDPDSQEGEYRLR